MELKILNNDELKKTNINHNLIKEKNILKSSIYLQVQGLYQKVLDYYILNNSSIKKYDDMISNSGLDFGLIDEKHKHIHHINSYLNLKYIYVRNFLFIEKLNMQQLSYIYNKILINDLNIDNQLIEIVKNTYKDVINDNYKHGEYKQNTTACYGSVIPDNIVASNSLVFCIHYGKNNIKLEKEAFLNNYKEKRTFLDNLKQDMEINLSKELNINVKILIRDYVGE